MDERNIFFTSDLHFGHTNVIKFDNRPFFNTREMDSKLIENWNDKVGKGDTVYILGDMFWHGNNEYVENILKALNGQKILIKGNHDRWIKQGNLKKYLSGVKDYDEINVKLKNGQDKRCILSHYFMPFYNSHYYNAIHLHGHSHNTDESKVELKIAKYLNDNGFANKIYNVGCMHWDYEPVTLDEILER